MGLKEVRKLEDLNYGAGNEQFERAFEEVIRNVVDPATDAKHKRQVIMTVTVVPNESRNAAAVMIDVKTKLAPIKKDEGSIMFDTNEHGKYVAKAYESEDQGELFAMDPKKEAVNGR